MHETSYKNHEGDNFHKNPTSTEDVYKSKHKKRKKEHRDTVGKEYGNIEEAPDKDEETLSNFSKSKHREIEFQHLETEKESCKNNKVKNFDEVGITADNFHKSRHKKSKKKQKEIDVTNAGNIRVEVPYKVDDIGIHHYESSNDKKSKEKHIDMHKAYYHEFSGENIKAPEQSHIFRHKKNEKKAKDPVFCENFELYEDESLKNFFEPKSKKCRLKSSEIINAYCDNDENDFPSKDEQTMVNHKSKHKKKKKKLNDIEETKCENIENKASDNDIETSVKHLSKHEKNIKKLNGIIETNCESIENKVLGKDEETLRTFYSSKHKGNDLNHEVQKTNCENNERELTDGTVITLDSCHKSNHKKKKKKHKRTDAEYCKNSEIPEADEALSNFVSADPQESEVQNLEMYKQNAKNNEEFFEGGIMLDNFQNLKRKKKKKKHKEIDATNYKNNPAENEETLNRFYKSKCKESQIEVFEVQKTHFENNMDELFNNTGITLDNFHKSKHKSRDKKHKKKDSRNCKSTEDELSCEKETISVNSSKSKHKEKKQTEMNQANLKNNEDEFNDHAKEKFYNTCKIKHKKSMRKLVEIDVANCKNSKRDFLANAPSSNFLAVEDSVQKYCEIAQGKLVPESRNLDCQKKKKNKKWKRDLELCQNLAIEDSEGISENIEKDFPENAQNSTFLPLEDFQNYFENPQEKSLLESRNLDHQKKKKHKKQKRNLELCQNSDSKEISENIEKDFPENALYSTFLPLEDVQNYFENSREKSLLESRNLDHKKKIKDKKQKRNLELCQNSDSKEISENIEKDFPENAQNSTFLPLEDVQNYFENPQEKSLLESRNLDHQKKKKHKKRKRNLESCQNSDSKEISENIEKYFTENAQNSTFLPLEDVQNYYENPQENSLLESNLDHQKKKKHKKRKRNLESCQNSDTKEISENIEHHFPENVQNSTFLPLEDVQNYFENPQEKSHLESRNLDHQKKEKHKKQKRILESCQNSDSKEMSENIEKDFPKNAQNSTFLPLEDFQNYFKNPQENSLFESNLNHQKKKKHKKNKRNLESCQNPAIEATEEISENLQCNHDIAPSISKKVSASLVNNVNQTMESSEKKNPKKRKRDFNHDDPRFYSSSTFKNMPSCDNIEPAVTVLQCDQNYATEGGHNNASLLTNEDSPNAESLHELNSDFSKNCDLATKIHKKQKKKQFSKSVSHGLENSDSQITETNLCMTDLDFNEDPVDFDIPPLHSCETVCPLKPKQKEELLLQGVKIKQGKFTPAEDAIISKNLQNFAEKYHIVDLPDLLGIGRYAKDYNLMKFIKAKHFYACLGKGLCDRPLPSIYKRARLLFDAHRSSEKSNNLNIGALKWLHKLQGNKWQKIGNTLGKTAQNCNEILRWHAKEDLNKNNWSKEEEENLIEAIQRVTKDLEGTDITVNNIPWEKVAAFVPKRNFSQCRWHWAQKLSKPSTSGAKWGKYRNAELISILKKDWNVTDASEIDWVKVYESFKDVIPSHIYLQKKWLTLKYKVPGYKGMDYNQILKHLCMMYNV